MPAFMQCSVWGCVNHGKKVKPPGIHLHRFPRSEPTRSKWLELLNWHGFPPSSKARVCSLHFVAGDYEHNPIALNSVGVVSVGLSRLKLGALPSLNLPGTSQLSQRPGIDAYPEYSVEPNSHEVHEFGIDVAQGETVGSSSHDASENPLYESIGQTVLKQDMRSPTFAMQDMEVQSQHMLSTSAAEKEQQDMYHPTVCVNVATHWCPVMKSKHVQTCTPRKQSKGTQADYQAKSMCSIGLQVQLMDLQNYDCCE
ncbi:uncharacterized protein LOC135378636 [Ornithodoros turicata]|uniref:uncharacterized protein LOC135378636 n=1 Tax=Ornithodoros turicata TaxID=34597 RepID=UPI0031386438